MKDDAQGVALSAAEAAHSVAHIDAVDAAAARHWPVMDGDTARATTTVCTRIFTVTERAREHGAAAAVEIFADLFQSK